jgi:putative radical SAM enzyme (TIGR03279 family)
VTAVAPRALSSNASPAGKAGSGVGPLALRAVSAPIASLGAAPAPARPNGHGVAARPSIRPPTVESVVPGSPAERAGIVPGDEVLTVAGEAPRDVIAWRLLVDQADPELEVRRGGLVTTVVVAKAEGEALGALVSSALFDQVRTCDNHCSFCFIYQLPPGMRQSLYLKDDDYRLSFLYGNFTTLTRFTELDLERVLIEGLSPLNVSIHSTDPELRATMLRNRRGATSLRWLKALLDAGVTVHGQVVVCPGVNDGAALADTFAGVLDEYSALASLAVVPLGISRFNGEPDLRAHTRAEAEAVVDLVADWQDVYRLTLGRSLVHAADEYYLMAGRWFPPAEAYDGFGMYEDGIGMARTFEAEFTGRSIDLGAGGSGPQAGFFAWVDGAPAEGYRAPRNPAGDTGLRTSAVPVRLAPRRAAGPAADAPIGILTAPYGAQVLGPLVAALGRDDLRLVPVANEYFGGNVGVTGLMVGADLARTLAAEPAGHRYLLPDVCLSQGRFLDGLTPDDLPHPVEVVPTDGGALRRTLEQRS